MRLVTKLTLAALALAVSACATKPAPPPAPISAAQFAAYSLANVTIDTDDATLIWPAAERDFARQKGISLPASSGAGGPDEQESDADRAKQAEYEAVIASDEAKAYYGTRIAPLMEASLMKRLAPEFTGSKPLNAIVDLEAFAVRSTGAKALGASEVVAGTIRFTELGSEVPIAESELLGGATASSSPAYYTGGGLAGFAISLAVSAAVNIALDSANDSHMVLADGYADKVALWLQLDPEPDE